MVWRLNTTSEESCRLVQTQIMKLTTPLIHCKVMTDRRLYYVRTEEMPSEGSAWLTASDFRNAADIVLESSVNKDRPAV